VKNTLENFSSYLNGVQVSTDCKGLDQGVTKNETCNSNLQWGSAGALFNQLECKYTLGRPPISKYSIKQISVYHMH